jgi:hypothetical protein
LIPSQKIESTLAFEMVNPNNSQAFSFVIKNGKIEVVTHKGNAIRPQINAYTERQLAIFRLLFPLIVDGVNETKRIYGERMYNSGKTRKSIHLVRRQVNETITMISDEPVVSLCFTREFTWQEKHRRAFEFLCASLR